MEPAPTVQEMRSAEAEAATRGISETALMQLAGHGAAEWIAAHSRAADRFLVLVGPGNNGGDALVVAACLQRKGAHLRIATYRRNQSEKPSAPDPPGTSEALSTCYRFDCTTQSGQAELAAALDWCTVVIDGLLGTGRSRPPDEALRAVLQAINRAQRSVLALDVPTGIDPDNGQADADAIAAQTTLVFGYWKCGLLMYPARAHTGSLQLVDIGLPKPPRVGMSAGVVQEDDIAAWLPERAVTAQKYSSGAVLALAGSPHYVGAPVLTCKAALRCGAGYVTLAIAAQAFQAVAGQLVEATMLLLPEQDQLKALQDVASRYRALLVGPGLGRDQQTSQLVREVLAGALHGPAAAVVDADALFALAQLPNWHSGVTIPLVLTPHSGEMARLTGLSTEEIERDRFSVASRFAALWKQVVVLKGAPTLVADPAGAISINSSGNQLLATAGTGDVLTGCIAALLAAGVRPFDAARIAVYVHGKAADIARERFGDRGMVAGDLLDLLPEVIKQLRMHCAPVLGAGVG